MLTAQDSPVEAPRNEEQAAQTCSLGLRLFRPHENPVILSEAKNLALIFSFSLHHGPEQDPSLRSRGQRLFKTGLRYLLGAGADLLILPRNQYLESTPRKYD